MTIPLIPRVRVNFKAGELARSMFVTDKRDKHRKAASELLSKSFDGREVILCSSGRTALYQILKQLPQRKVMIPAYTCACVPEAARYAGKQIIYVRTESDTFNANHYDISDADTVVVATHQYGFPCDIEAISQECKRKGAVLIEDCAAAFGYTINGWTVGTYGDYAIVSFNSSKLINVPSRGGAIIVGKGNEEVAHKVLNTIELPPPVHKLKNIIKGFIYCVLKNKLVYRAYHYLLLQRRGRLHFSDNEKPDAPMDVSYKYGMSEWQAYILNRQLLKLDGYVRMRMELQRAFDAGINNPKVSKPPMREGICCCRYTIKVKERQKFYDACLKQGVDMDFSHSYIACPEEFSEEHSVSDEILNIPFYPDMSNKEVKRVIQAINNIK